MPQGTWKSSTRVDENLSHHVKDTETHLLPDCSGWVKDCTILSQTPRFMLLNLLDLGVFHSPKLLLRRIAK